MDPQLGARVRIAGLVALAWYITIPVSKKTYVSGTTAPKVVVVWLAGATALGFSIVFHRNQEETNLHV